MSLPRTLVRNLTIGAVLLMSGGVFVVGLTIAGATTWAAFDRVGIGGSTYQHIVAGKDLLSDILPPPEYVIEPYLEANLIFAGEGALADHKARLVRLRKDFDDRRAYWRNSPLPEEIKREIVDSAGGEADAIWRELDGEFLPAAALADRAALAASFKRLSRHYLAHRAIIDDIVAKSNEFVAAVEADAADDAARSRARVAGIFGLLLAGLAAGVVGLRHGVARAVSVVADRLAGLASRTSRFAEATNAQTQLDANLTALRSALYARGSPRLIGDRLYFGDYLINGETEIVDGVSKRYGGVATVFAHDARVATNLRNDAGGRAVGTRLAQGQVHERLFGAAAMFQGEAEILGRPYVTIYEPILLDDGPIGAIFVGVPFDRDAGADRSTEPGPRNEVARMTRALAIVEAAVDKKDEIEREALRQRYQVADESRRTAARAAASAAGQQAVVTHLSEALQSLADNDLTHRIESEFPEEYRELKLNFARAAETLAQALAVVVAQGRTIGEVSAEISENADDLSRRSEQQAANLKEIAVAIDEIASSSRRAADGAAHAREVVASADADAARSAVVVDEAVSAMHAIDESASKITEIIGLIDEIAFQTNLLALNAGVEAARAGDAGRGFAVVAAEVRALALRSSGAAKDIRSLIDVSAHDVRRGVELVSRTGEALKRIVGQVAKLSGIVGEIAKGAKDQANGLSEVNSSIGQIDQITQANATIAQRSTEAARALSAEAERLNALVGQFRIPGSGDERARAA